MFTSVLLNSLSSQQSKLIYLLGLAYSNFKYIPCSSVFESFLINIINFSHIKNCSGKSLGKFRFPPSPHVKKQAKQSQIK